MLHAALPIYLRRTPLSTTDCRPPPPRRRWSPACP